MSKGKSLLNALTIVGYVFVGLFVFVAVYLGIAYAAGYFNPHKEPVLGLKFNTEETIVISENGGTFELKVVDINATITNNPDGTQTIDDKATPVDVKLTVRNMSGTIDNSIISVPDIVTMGEAFSVEAVIDETDGYDCNRGGDCYIVAETTDGTFRSQSLAVFVDVPVKEIEVLAKNPVNGSAIDLATADFIYGDSVQLVTNVYPTRALNPHRNGNASDNKVVTFTSDETAHASVGLNTGLVNVTYRDDSAGDEPVVDPEFANITISIQDVYDSTKAELVPTECQLRLFPIQLKSIIIQNNDYEAENSIVKTALHFDNNTPLRFSATDTGVEGVINLDLYLEPTKSNEYNASNPLYEQLGDFYIKVSNSFTRGDVSWNAENPPLDCYCDTETGIWTIVPLRTQEPDEEITLEFGIGNHTIVTTRAVEIEFSTPENFTFVNGETAIGQNEVVDLTIVKDGDIISSNADFIVTSTYNTEKNPTFSKFVYFIDTSTLTNETGSLVVDANDETGELVLHQKTDGEGMVVIGEALKALGAGNIKVRPYVVRTNKNGQPIDCDYNVITDATGFVEYSPTTAITDAAGKYIVYNTANTYNSLNVKVTEKLQQFKIYGSTDFNDENELTNNIELEIGTQDYNAKTLYAVPNSPLSLPTSATYEEWSAINGNFTFLLSSVAGGGDGELFVPQNEITFVEDETSGYVRYLAFKVYTKDAVEIKSNVSIYLDLDASTSLDDYSVSNEIIVSAKNIPISSIALKNASEHGIATGLGAYYNINDWQLNLDISTSAYTYGKKSYLKIGWKTSNNKNIIIPNLTYVAPEKWAEAGFKPSTASKYINFLAFDVTTQYTYNEESMGTIYDLLDTTYTDPAKEKWKWETIKNLVNSTSKNTYASIVNIGATDDPENKEDLDTQTIQFKFNEKLADNYKLFMVYSIYEDIYNVDEATYDAGGDVKPIFVRLDYALPAVHFFTEGCVSPVAGDNNTIALAEDSRDFFFYDQTFFKALAYDPTSGAKYTDATYDFEKGSLVDKANFRTMFTDISTETTITDGFYASCFGGDKDYFNFELASEESLPEELNGYYLKISLKPAYSVIADTDGAVNNYSLTQTRVVNFVADAWWDDAKWEAFGKATDAEKSAYSGYFSNVYSVENDYVINFIGESLKIAQ